MHVFIMCYIMCMFVYVWMYIMYVCVYVGVYIIRDNNQCYNNSCAYMEWKLYNI